LLGFDVHLGGEREDKLRRNEKQSWKEGHGPELIQP